MPLPFCSCPGETPPGENDLVERCPKCGAVRLMRPACEFPPLRSRRWSPGSSGVKGQPAGADCMVCRVPCEPIFGFGYCCPKCGAQAPACGDRYGFKTCELLRGHESYHESQSGTSWPQRPAAPAPVPPLVAEALRTEGGRTERARVLALIDTRRLELRLAGRPAEHLALTELRHLVAEDTRPGAARCDHCDKPLPCPPCETSQALADRAAGRPPRDLTDGLVPAPPAAPRAPDGPGDPLTLARESTHRPADQGPRPTYPPTGWGEG